MPGWYAEARKEHAGGSIEAWARIGGPYKTQERAKAECAKTLKGATSKRLQFRTVADDDGGTVYQISYPPHGRRMRWINAEWYKVATMIPNERLLMGEQYVCSDKKQPVLSEC